MLSTRIYMLMYLEIELAFVKLSFLWVANVHCNSATQRKWYVNWVNELVHDYLYVNGKV